MNNYYIAIQGTYSQVDIALFFDDTVLESIQETNATASSQLIPLISTLLENNDLTLADITFIAADHGPGAFTSLRVTLATLNGIAFSSATRLVGVDGLDALARESFEHCKSKSIAYVVPMLNAYHQDIYVGKYAVLSTGTLVQQQAHKAENIDRFLDSLSEHTTTSKILFVGNGAQLYQDRILARSELASIIAPAELSVASATSIGMQGIVLWNAGKSSTQLRPHYLKTQQFAIKYHGQSYTK